MVMASKKEVIAYLGLDENHVSQCGAFECCHFGEGCALNYPLIAELNDFGVGSSRIIDELEQNTELRRELKKFYSAEFAQQCRVIPLRDSKSPD